MSVKQEQMMAFWSDRSRSHGADPRANTNDVHLRSLEIDFVASWIAKEQPATVLDFGCANGYTTLKLAERFPRTSFVGLDINPDMIDVATQSGDGALNVRFMHADVVRDGLPDAFDMVFTVRVFQNMESLEAQKAVADVLCSSLKPGGVLLYLESYAKGYREICEDRVRLNLDPLPNHPHITWLEPEFDEHVARKLSLIERASPSSTYYLVTRLVYSSFAKQRGEAIDYDHLLHRLAAQVPQIGEYGPQAACVLRKPSGRQA